MDHEAVLPAELRGRPVLVVRAPGRSDPQLRALRDFLAESLALGVLVLGQHDTFALECFPDLGGVACRADGPAGEGEEWEPPEAPEQPEVPEQLLREHPAPGKVLTGRNAGEKQAILARLKAYRKARGLGCLDEVARAAGGDFTPDLLRRILSGEASLDIVQWRRLGKALAGLEAKEGAGDGESN